MRDACLPVQNLVAAQPEMFKQQLHQMWFSFYSRSNVRDDTCGFEHGAAPNILIDILIFPHLLQPLDAWTWCLVPL